MPVSRSGRDTEIAVCRSVVNVAIPQWRGSEFPMNAIRLSWVKGPQAFFLAGPAGTNKPFAKATVPVGADAGFFVFGFLISRLPRFCPLAINDLLCVCPIGPVGAAWRVATPAAGAIAKTGV